MRKLTWPSKVHDVYDMCNIWQEISKLLANSICVLDNWLVYRLVDKLGIIRNEEEGLLTLHELGIDP